jgi:hypothetical protein
MPMMKGSMCDPTMLQEEDPNVAHVPASSRSDASCVYSRNAVLRAIYWHVDNSVDVNDLRNLNGLLHLLYVWDTHLLEDSTEPPSWPHLACTACRLDKNCQSS